MTLTTYESTAGRLAIGSARRAGSPPGPLNPSGTATLPLVSLGAWAKSDRSSLPAVLHLLKLPTDLDACWGTKGHMNMLRYAAWTPARQHARSYRHPLVPCRLFTA